ncbi:hypothetical protein DSO57_1030285 [Entomophthora muscae]|uniref:Uncharacterized protein n=1 Tax=Entomophthora muscae TaxID=34485 RepID=A0ACC2SDV3_9FUNG|nr:hypothetical protein DSO57_1030285 [Entomophthora muscae]
MPSGAYKVIAHLLRSHSKHLHCDVVMRQLNKPDSGKTDGSSDEVVDIRAGLGGLEPAKNVEPFGVKCTGIWAQGMGAKHI